MRFLQILTLFFLANALGAQVPIFQLERIPAGYYIADFDGDGYNDTVRIKATDVQFLPDTLLTDQTAADSTLADILTIMSGRVDSLAADTLASDVYVSDSLVGPTVQDELIRLDHLSDSLLVVLETLGEGAQPNDPVSLTAPGVSVIVEYKGTDPPTLSGTTGQYVLTEKSGTEIENVTLVALGAATSGNACSLTLVSEDMHNRWSTASVFDQGGNFIPIDNRPIGLNQASSTQGSVTVELTEISAFPNFVMFLYR